MTYAFDSSGRVRVRARDVTGGKEATIDIERKSGLDDKQVDAYTSLANDYVVE